MFRLRIAMTLGLLFSAVQFAHAQVPFFAGRGNAFTPEISVINTGALLDAQAVVSSDRKYVTINARPANSSLLALRSFTFQNAPMLGFVGDPPPLPPVKTGVDGSSIGNDPATAVRTSPTDILQFAKAQASILHRDGMTRVSLIGSPPK